MGTVRKDATRWSLRRVRVMRRYRVLVGKLIEIASGRS